MSLLVAMVTVCSRSPHFDSRLIVADSLMRDYPDSALAIVQAVTHDSLAGEGDRAYRDLLLTQARYKCYITATSDSDINHALYYFCHHDNEREKLTRSYIYKGAVMEELGHPDSAMLYYKCAEATADERDYINMGQINTRIAALYRVYFANEEVCFDKYKTALHFYQLTGNKSMQQNSLYNMAVCLSVSKVGNPLEYLYQALDLAFELKDSANVYKCQERLCRLLSMHVNSN